MFVFRAVLDGWNGLLPVCSCTLTNPDFCILTYNSHDHMFWTWRLTSINQWSILNMTQFTKTKSSLLYHHPQLNIYIIFKCISICTHKLSQLLRRVNLGAWICPPPPQKKKKTDTKHHAISHTKLHQPSKHPQGIHFIGILVRSHWERFPWRGAGRVLRNVSFQRLVVQQLQVLEMDKDLANVEPTKVTSDVETKEIGNHISSRLKLLDETPQNLHNRWGIPTFGDGIFPKQVISSEIHMEKSELFRGEQPICPTLGISKRHFDPQHMPKRYYCNSTNRRTILHEHFDRFW